MSWVWACFITVFSWQTINTCTREANTCPLSVFMECSSTSTAKSFCEIIFLYTFPIPAPYVIAQIRKLSPAYFLSVLPLWLPHSHTSWIFSFLCLAFVFAFIKISLYFCCFVSLWFSAFMSFKCCSLFLSTGNVRSSSLVSFVIHVQTAVYTGQVQEKLNSSICWKQLQFTVRWWKPVPCVRNTLK